MWKVSETKSKLKIDKNNGRNSSYICLSDKFASGSRLSVKKEQKKKYNDERFIFFYRQYIMLE